MNVLYILYVLFLIQFVSYIKLCSLCKNVLNCAFQMCILYVGYISIKSKNIFMQNVNNLYIFYYTSIKTFWSWYYHHSKLSCIRLSCLGFQPPTHISLSLLPWSSQTIKTWKNKFTSWAPVFTYVKYKDWVTLLQTFFHFIEPFFISLSLEASSHIVFITPLNKFWQYLHQEI